MIKHYIGPVGWPTGADRVPVSQFPKNARLMGWLGSGVRTPPCGSDRVKTPPGRSVRVRTPPCGLDRVKTSPRGSVMVSTPS